MKNKLLSKFNSLFISLMAWCVVGVQPVFGMARGGWQDQQRQQELRQALERQLEDSIYLLQQRIEAPYRRDPQPQLEPVAHIASPELAARSERIAQLAQDPNVLEALREGGWRLSDAAREVLFCPNEDRDCQEWVECFDRRSQAFDESPLSPDLHKLALRKILLTLYKTQRLLLEDKELGCGVQCSDLLRYFSNLYQKVNNLTTSSRIEIVSRNAERLVATFLGTSLIASVLSRYTLSSVVSPNYTPLNLIVPSRGLSCRLPAPHCTVLERVVAALSENGFANGAVIYEDGRIEAQN